MKLIKTYDNGLGGKVYELRQKHWSDVAKTFAKVYPSKGVNHVR